MPRIKNFSLIAGIALPILMILFVALSIYVPRMFVHPQYNFVFSMNDNAPYGSSQFSVENGAIVQHAVQYPDTYPKPVPPLQPMLYVYDVRSDQAHLVTWPAAKKLHVSGDVTSPDGYQAEQGRGGGGYIFPFIFEGGYDGSNLYLTGHGGSKRVNVPMANYYYNFHFIGWVLP